MIRTWFFVKDIDSHYNGLVTGQNEVFDQHGLPKDTHYIASTGIEGAHHDVHAKVLMDAYAIAGGSSNPRAAPASPATIQTSQSSKGQQASRL